MSTYLYYTQGILDFQEETTTYSEERLEIRLKRRKHRCPKCKSKDVTLRALYERDVRGLAMGRIREVHFIYTLHQVYCHRCHERSIELCRSRRHPLQTYGALTSLGHFSGENMRHNSLHETWRHVQHLPLQLV